MSARIKIRTVEEYEIFRTYLRDRIIPRFETRAQKKIFLKQADKMQLINDRIFIINGNAPLLEYIEDFNETRKRECIERLHLGSHRGLHALFRELNNRYYNIKQSDVKNVLRDCRICSTRTVHTVQTTTTPIIILNKFDRFQCDITYLLEYEADNSGFKYILTVIDCSTKFSWAFPCITKSAQEVHFNLSKIFYGCNIPKELHTDNGLEFRNNLIANLCRQFNIRQIFGAPYHPQSQGQIERYNFTLKRMLISVMNYSNTRNWILILDKTVYEYNLKHNRSVNDSPVNLFHGFRGFNNDINLIEFNNTPSLNELTNDERRILGEFRINYYSSLASNVTRKTRRLGQNIPHNSTMNENERENDRQ